MLSVAQGWSEDKGLFKIFEVAKQLPEDRFVLVGRVAYDGEMPENVISVGVTSSTDELAQYYSMADTLLVCSVQETFGKVSAEALSCGTPVIANNSTANPELCGNGCGFIIDNNDHEQMIKAINTIRKNGKSAYTNRCRSFAQDNFDKEKGIDNYVALFTEMIKGKSK